MEADADDARGRGRDTSASTSDTTAQLHSPLLTPTSPPAHESDSDASSQGQSTAASSVESAGAEPQLPPPPPPDPSKEQTPGIARHRTPSTGKASQHIRRLSATKMQELTGSLPIAAIPDHTATDSPFPAGRAELEPLRLGAQTSRPRELCLSPQSDGTNGRLMNSGRPTTSSRTLSTPPTTRRKSSSQPPSQGPVRRNSLQPPPPLSSSSFANSVPKAVPPPRPEASEKRLPPPIPLPPMSIPTLLQLELAGQRPSPLYIHHSQSTDIPYESSAVKFERLKNFLLLPSYLERTMNFGALACLDAWLWTFTILPMRFCVALGVLIRWWAYVMVKEARWLTGFVWEGLGRMWQRGRRGRSSSRARAAAGDGSKSSAGEESRSRSRIREAANGTSTGTAPAADGQPSRRLGSSRLNSTAHPPSSRSKSHQNAFRHRRTKSMPSGLTSCHKADLLQGAVIIFSSIALMNLDASRMYHFVRAQSAVKLYVIYNLVEVGDRLLSAVGQDIFECLFSSETLSRNASGRSKVLLPFGMFLLSLAYNVAHAVVLFYQVITLNVAVNSYSNALLSLLMSNQFVEVKSSVFKRCEKENTFQLTLADIVERFQLWIVLIIIAMRNIVEVGGLSVPGAGVELGGADELSAKVPLHNTSILPASFTILPSWLASGAVLSPFLVVIGSEMLVDWIKHAYINKFNNIKPTFYSRILDILCKDYYTNAFVTPSMTRRLGLPLLPLCCLFIRAAVQTYHMFLATHLPMPLPPSTQTSLSVESATATSPAMAAALDRIDLVIRNALGRAVYGYPYNATGAAAVTKFGPWTSDDLIASLTMVVFFFIAFLVLLVFKLLLGMLLLRYSRNRYARMKAMEQAVAAGTAEPQSFEMAGKRVGSYGQVEVGEDRRRWLFGDDPEGLRKLREKEQRDANKGKKEIDLGSISRYEMIAKRIW